MYPKSSPDKQLLVRFMLRGLGSRISRSCLVEGLLCWFRTGFPCKISGFLGKGLVETNGRSRTPPRLTRWSRSDSPSCASRCASGLAPASNRKLRWSGSPYSKYPLLFKVLIEKPRRPWEIPPFSVEGQHRALKKSRVQYLEGAPKRSAFFRTPHEKSFEWEGPSCFEPS